MTIKSIELQNFRNYETLHIALNQGTNIFFGDNAQGKTNILESAYVSGTTRSHKGSKDKDMIRFGEQEAHIRTMVNKNGQEFQIDIHLKKNRAKGIAVNRVPIKKAGELFGILNIVFFSPEDLNLIKNGPSERRRFLDMELCQLDKIYLNSLVNYNKVIIQRNKLLKELSFEYNREKLETLDIWDIQLVRYGSAVIRAREELIRQIGGIVSDIHAKLSGGKEILEIRYAPCVSQQSFEEQVRAARERDIRLKATGTGPHKDDLIFYIGGQDVRRFGSQGQQRTAALSLKLAEIELVKKRVNDTPVLLLDDVLSELDSSRQNFLLNSMNDIQTIITCTGLDEFIQNHFAAEKIFRVENGSICLCG